MGKLNIDELLNAENIGKNEKGRKNLLKLKILGFWIIFLQLVS